MSQLRADIWCAAFVRRHNDLGHMCVIVRRGDPIAGQIWVEHDGLDGHVSLYGPAPTLFYSQAERLTDRLFQPVLTTGVASDVGQRLAREARFDPDFWHILLEMRGEEIDIGLSLAEPSSKT